jgi:hypothetical protein
MCKWLCLIPFLSFPAFADQVQITSPLPLPITIGNNGIQLDSAGRSDDQPVYIGFAAPGTSTSSSGWKIMELIYDTSGNISQVLWANGTANFDKTWTSRAGYSYS